MKLGGTSFFPFIKAPKKSVSAAPEQVRSDETPGNTAPGREHFAELPRKAANAASKASVTLGGIPISDFIKPPKTVDAAPPLLKYDGTPRKAAPQQVQPRKTATSVRNDHRQARDEYEQVRNKRVPGLLGIGSR